MLDVALERIAAGTDESVAVRELLFRRLVLLFGEVRGTALFSTLTKNENGKPMLDGLCVSFSHTRGFCAVALSDTAVGVDVEPVVPLTERRRAILARYFPAEATAEADADESGVAFAAFWTRREAAFKAYATLPFYVENPVAGHENAISTEYRTVNGVRLCLSVAHEIPAEA